MIEAIGKLIEEPAKRKMYLVFAVKMILSGILTDYIYREIFGPYVLIEPFGSDFYASFYQFVFSGELLVVLLLYFSCGIALFGVLTVVLNMVMGILCPKKADTPLKDSTFVRLMLSWTQAIKMDSKAKIFKRGRDFESFYAMIMQYRKKSVKRAIEGFKHSLINEIIQLYSAFVILYYFILDIDSKPLLNVIVALAGFSLVVFYIALHNLTRFIDLNENGLYAAVRMLKADETISELLTDSYLTVSKPERLRGTPCAVIITVAGGDILLDYYLTEQPIDTRMAERITNQKDKMQCIGIIIINCLGAPIREDVVVDSTVHIVHYRSEKKLRAELASILYEIRRFPIPEAATS